MFSFTHTVEGQYEQIIKYFNTFITHQALQIACLHLKHIQSIITCILLHNTNNYLRFKRFGDKPGQVGV